MGKIGVMLEVYMGQTFSLQQVANPFEPEHEWQEDLEVDPFCALEGSFDSMSG